MHHKPWERPDYVSTGFIFTMLLLGAIVLPFIWCGKQIGCVDENFGESPPPPDCKLATQEQCDHRRKMKILHPTWYEGEDWEY